MGSGKTQFAIKMMNEASYLKKFIYVTPFLNEVTRVKESVTTRTFIEPDPQHGEGRKYEHFKRLIKNGKNIVTTHALFSRADDELLELLRYENYTLIIDEVMDVIDIIKMKRNDIQILLDSNVIKINDNKQIEWISDSKFDSRYNDIKDYALAGNLFFVRDSAMIWNFPAKIFDVFDEVYILTYMFEGQIQRYYYDMHNVKYQYYSVNNGELIPFTRKYENREQLKQLINIYDGKLNDIGERKNNLSVSWFKRNKKSLKMIELKNNLYNYLRNIIKADSEDIMWTTWKEYKNKIQGNGFTKKFVAWNIRATNDYIDKNTLAFCINRFLNPIEDGFFIDHNVEVNQEMIALTDMLQWIFRSAIRQNKPINIYIPSSRMRNLLIGYLNGDY